ncbi:hypothetical protein VTN77DRAFT_1391 [Rasamsonia byssochlamydoides]|uniref:uncharacterized protein n=1 Tax=Rasamsonia byssochlamydoides TaxID=89139 RepID=UPI0037425BF3
MLQLTGLFVASLSATLLSARTTHAANATTISSTGCVDPSAFDKCISAAASKEGTCIDEAGGNDGVVIACGWQKDVDEMLCYMESCWNKVYSCEYQYLVASYLVQRTSSETIPFFPAPDNAPGGCSCNLGKVLVNATNSIEQASSCAQYTLASQTDLLTCQCCAWSAGVSAFYGICPDTDPTGLGVSALDNEAMQFEQISGSCSNLTSSVCLGEFGIGSADNGKYLDPDNLPAPGTQALSTTAGQSSLTTPPGGATMTVTVLSATYTVTAAPYNAANVQSGSSSGSSSSTSTSSSSGSSGSSGSNSGSSGSSSGSSGTSGKPSAASSMRETSICGVVILVAVMSLVLV